ncbi:MAG TPA: hypothetical protein VGJ71_07185 [Candidatus Limnocylindrales bacterium]|jgi:hypothetical protein
MPFPFLPLGAVVAASILIAALTVFGLALRAIDRTVVGLRDTMLSGVVSGLRTWSGSRAPRRTVTSSSGAASPSSPAGSEIVDLNTRRI